MYANIDKYQPSAEPFPPPEAELDKWILSELNQLIADVDAALDGYNPTDAGRKIENFVDGFPTGMSGGVGGVSGRVRTMPISFPLIIPFIIAW